MGINPGPIMARVESDIPAEGLEPATAIEKWGDLQPSNRYRLAKDIGRVLWEHAFETGDDETAIAWTEGVLAPYVDHYFQDNQPIQPGFADVNPDNCLLHQEYWQEVIRTTLQDFEDIEYDGMRDLEAVNEFLSMVEGAVKSLHPSYLGGNFGSAYHLQYAHISSADERTITPFNMRYSGSRGDNEVSITPRMEDRLDVEGQTVLLLEDGISTGRTAAKLGEEFVGQRDASDVYLLAYHEGHEEWRTYRLLPSEERGTYQANSDIDGIIYFEDGKIAGSEDYF